MTVTSRTRAVPPRVFVSAVLVGLALCAALVWFRGADERRVDHACGTWLGEREGLRTVLAETEEAVGRAGAEGDRDVSRQFNDLDTTLASLEQWESTGPKTRDSLHGGRDASRTERGADWAFGVVNSGVTGLHKRIDDGDPSELTAWAPEVRARFQIVDDVCLAAARS